MNRPRQLRPAVWAFVGISFGTLVWRAFMIPWDMGGTWFHLWSCAVGTVALARLRNAPPRLRVFGVIVVYSTGVLIAIGGMYFRPQSLFNFLFLGGILVLFCWVWPKASRLGHVAVAAVFSILLVAFVYGCVDGLGHMRKVLELRFLGSKPDSVESIELVPPASDTSTPAALMRLTGRNRIRAILEALRKTYPYSPNHEGIRNAWQMRLRLQSGERLIFELGQGNRAHPDAAWITFDRCVYQNEKLNRTLTVDLGLPLWN
jgi:hypothetical protein